MAIQRKLVVLCGLFTLLQGTANAEEPTGTLKKIKDTNVIVVGNRDSSIPFSYYDKDQNVIGYSQDYSNEIVEAVKKELNLPNLQVKYVPITSKTRIPLLNNYTYDFECGSTTHNVGREKVVDFSDTIYISGTRFLVHKDSGIKDINDLKGKNVATTAGTTSEIRLNQINNKDKLEMRIIATKDHGDSFNTLESGRAVAFLMDDALLAGERSRAIKPDEWIIVGEPLSYEAYGCMLRKDDQQFKQLVNKTIAEAQTSGNALKSYNRWFTQPVPLKGANMNLDISPVMLELFSAPNDKALN